MSLKAEKPKVSSAGPTTENDERVISRRGVLLGALALGVAGVAAMAKGVSGIDPLVSPKIEDEVVPEPRFESEPEPEPVKKPFEVDYQPNADVAQIVAKKLKPGAKRTIIYIADRHADDGDPNGMRCQSEIYAVLEELVGKYDRLPLVIENWIKGAGTTDFSRVIDDESLLGIMREQDLKKRQEMAKNAVGTSSVPVGMYAMVSWPNMVPIGPLTMAELIEVSSGIENIQQVGAVLNDPSLVVCPDDEKITYADAIKHFSKEKGKAKKGIVDCYCDVRRRLRDMADGFFNDRLVNVPKKEIAAVVDHFNTSDDDFVVVVAGSNHIPESVKSMDALDVNYIVVSPKCISDRFPVALTETVRVDIDKHFPDSKGVCAGLEPDLVKREEEQRRRAEEKRAQALQQWLMED